MPIEIRELVIRTTVSPGGADAGGGSRSTGSRASGGEADREAMVAEIVREVMRALREQSER